MYPWGALQNRPVPLLDPSRTHTASKEAVAKPFSSPQGQRKPAGAGLGLFCPFLENHVGLKVTYHCKPGLLQQLPLKTASPPLSAKHRLCQGHPP